MCVLMFKRAHVPDGEIADALASTPASTTAADAPVNYSLYVPQRPEDFPSPQWENALPQWNFHMFCACACRAAVRTSAVAR